MNQFTFEGRQRGTFLIMIAIGLISLAVTWFSDDAFHSRFWSNILHNSVFFTGIALMALFMLSAKITAWSGFHTLFKRLWEAYSLFLIIGLILMLLIAAGIWGHFHHLYHWADSEAVADDVILTGKSGFLNRNWFTLGTTIIMAAWILIALRLRALSLQEDESGDATFSHHKKMRIWAAIALPVIGFSSAGVIWQWIMSVDAHWYSTLFAWYCGASWVIAMFAVTITMLFYLKSKGYFPQINMEHLHDLGKYLFAISIFWTYLWFSQYMLIWYGNVGEETIYFKTRIDEYPVLFYMNLAVNFFLPFFVLMRNDTKRKAGTMVFTSLVVFLGHWLDYFLMIKPGVLHTSHELAASHESGHTVEGAEHISNFVAGFSAPGFLEFGTLIGFLGLFLYFVFNRLTQASLVSRNDPYLAESIHHHV
jgi:hypothetical protein